MLALGFLLVLALNAFVLKLASDLLDEHLHGRQLRLGAARRARRRGGQRRARGDLRDERRRHVHPARRPADRAPAGRRRGDRRAGDRLPRDRRARAPGAAAGDARRQRAARWRAGSPRARTGWPSGRPTSPRRRARARRGSCSARTRTSPRSGGSTRRPACSPPARRPPTARGSRRERATGIGLLVDGGASRGNLLSGEAEEVILTVSRMEAEKRANPGYRAFFANGFNVTRALVLFVWEVHPRVDGGPARDPPRRPPARAPRRHLPVHPRARCASSSAT